MADPSRKAGGRRTVADPTETTGEAVIDSVGFDVAHDSDGIVVLTLRFPNGARSDLSVEGQAIGRLVAALLPRGADSEAHAATFAAVRG